MLLKRGSKLFLDTETEVFEIPLLRREFSSSITYKTSEQGVKSLLNPLLQPKIHTVGLNDGTFEFSFYVPTNNTKIIAPLLRLLGQVNQALANPQPGDLQILSFIDLSTTSTYSRKKVQLFTAYLQTGNYIKKINNVSLNEVTATFDKKGALSFSCSCTYTHEEVTTSIPTLTLDATTATRAYVPIPVKAFLATQELGKNCDNIMDATVSIRKEIKYLDQKSIQSGLAEEVYKRDTAVVDNFTITGTIKKVKDASLQQFFNDSLEIKTGNGGANRAPELTILVPNAYISERDSDSDSIYTTTLDYRAETTSNYEPPSVSYFYY